ncbi:hypothetical protein Sjap_008392 [Stephania japonica]|uniref:Uncharacterized protein n=1 Tax=Stephania japonica TaxID=461633 RepID=A0AAP0PAU4_9MAGN
MFDFSCLLKLGIIGYLISCTTLLDFHLRYMNIRGFHIYRFPDFRLIELFPNTC